MEIPMKKTLMVVLAGLAISAAYSEQERQRAEQAELAQTCKAESLAAANYKPGEPTPKWTLACFSWEASQDRVSAPRG
jgi:hypothetical protein